MDTIALPVPSSAGGGAGMEADVWLLDISGVSEGELTLALLDENERGRAERFVREADRIRYIAAHTAVRVLLGERLGVDARRLRFTREPCPGCGAPHGRPALDLSPRPLHFSLSHGGSVVAVAAAAVPVGVDTEPLPQRAAIADIAGMLHPAEQADLAEAEALGSPRHAAVLARIWVRKEAYLKGIGTGLSRDLAADYLGGSARAAGPEGWSVLDLEPRVADHAAAVALRTVAAPAVGLRHLSAPEVCSLVRMR